MILAGDIGGTKTHLASFTRDAGTLRMESMASYASREFASLEEILKVHLKKHPVAPTAAAFGIAGPVVGGSSKLTNLGWDVGAQSLAALLKLDDVGLINDLQATAYGTLQLGDADRTVLNTGTPVQGGTIAVIAAGTGLGEGALVWDGHRYRAIASEGGHSDFAPRNELEIELLRFLLSQHERVSCERVVSGPGLFTIYQFLRLKAASPEPAWLAEQFALKDQSAVVADSALLENDETCVRALELFVSLYGAEAGNLALKFLATGGVFVGGGIAPKILYRIQHGPFMDSFARKGRYEELLREIPVHIIMNDKAALFGAAHYAELMHG